MTHPKSNDSDAMSAETAKSVETQLRGAALNASDQKASVDNVEYEKSRNPDAELHLDGEDDSLYSDGLKIGDDSETLAGTDGNAPKGIKG